MNAHGLILNSRRGLTLMFLLMWLGGCATAPSLLPQQRVVVSCPSNLVFLPSPDLPIPPEQLTNLGLKRFAEDLMDYVEAEWNRALDANAQCKNWLKSQQ